MTFSTGPNFYKHLNIIIPILHIHGRQNIILSLGGSIIVPENIDTVYLKRFREITKELNKLRLRLKHGAKEELLPLLRLKGIGRVRARRMYNNRIKNLGDVKEVDYVKLAEVIGRKVALDVKKQVGQDFSKVKVKENKRKGQISLNDY